MIYGITNKTEPMKTVEELLKPRYKVIADYPGNQNPIGTILKTFNCWHDFTIKFWCKSNDKYPHLLQPLPWWSDRELGDMPEYLKIIKSPMLTAQYLSPGDIVKAHKHFSCSQGKHNKMGCQIFGDDFCSYGNTIPATGEEYKLFKQQKEK